MSRRKPESPTCGVDTVARAADGYFVATDARQENVGKKFPAFSEDG
jgi:hypothetical protein